MTTVFAAPLLLLVSLSVLPGETPATVQEAAKTIDLGQAPTPEGAEIAQQNIAVLSYQAKEKVADAFARHQKHLKSLGFKQEQGEMVSEQYASAAFSKSKFRISLTITPSGPDLVLVTLNNLGNIRPSEIPLLPGGKTVYSGPDTAIFTVEQGVDDARTALKEHLKKLGWTPYGDADPISIFKQNGIRLVAMVTAAPGQQGKTTINLSCHQVSADLPVPENAEQIQYADASKPHVGFETTLSEAEVYDFYRTALAKEGWEPTTKEPITESFEKILIFYNKGMGNIFVKVRQIEGKQRVMVEHFSLAEWARIEKRAAERKEKSK